AVRRADRLRGDEPPGGAASHLQFPRPAAGHAGAAAGARQLHRLSPERVPPLPADGGARLMRALLDRLFPARAMREIGVLGMNGRNINYISRYNSRQLYPLVDDKLKTKQLALEHGVTTPELIGVISAQHDVRRIAELVKGHDGFCIKPAKGSGGKGILVVARVEDGRFFRTNGTEIPLIDLQRHLSNVLAGLFSLGGAPDVAIIEALIR